MGTRRTKNLPRKNSKPKISLGAPRQQAVFLDRDGVICKHRKDYVKKWDEFKFLPGAKKAIKILKENRFKVIIISNQAGVGKGIISLSDFDKINVKMQKEIVSAGGKIDDIYYCLHKKEDDCPCRKPKIKMLKDAIKQFQINTKKSFMVGDQKKDIIAAKKAGIKSVFVKSGEEKERNILSLQPDFIYKNLFEFAVSLNK